MCLSHSRKYERPWCVRDDSEMSRVCCRERKRKRRQIGVGILGAVVGGVVIGAIVALVVTLVNIKPPTTTTTTSKQRERDETDTDPGNVFC